MSEHEHTSNAPLRIGITADEGRPSIGIDDHGDPNPNTTRRGSRAARVSTVTRTCFETDPRNIY